LAKNTSTSVRDRSSQKDEAALGKLATALNVPSVGERLTSSSKFAESAPIPRRFRGRQKGVEQSVVTARTIFESRALSIPEPQSGLPRRVLRPRRGRPRVETI
jgi:hypothetical protein